MTKRRGLIKTTNLATIDKGSNPSTTTLKRDPNDQVSQDKGDASIGPGLTSL